MQIGIRIAACALLLSTFWWACKDIDLYDIPDGGATRNISFSGRVVDESFQPVVGAQVSAGTASSTTDENGVFRLQTISAPSDNAILRVKKPGFFEFSRAYSFQHNTQTALTIQLLEKKVAMLFDNASGGTIVLPGNVRVVFPANAVAYADGQPYFGQVYTYGKYLNPEAEYLALHMPGDLRGIDATGEEKVLSTFGMFVLELYSESGVLLNLASGKQADISMPVPPSMSNSAPANIPLWYYDMEQARWMEEGSAQRVGNNYEGKVSHFSFWNCDYPNNLIKISGNLFVQNNTVPASNATIAIKDSQTGFTGYGYVNADGSFSGFIPQNKQLTISVSVFSGNCYSQVYGPVDIGPFTTDAQLPDIIINPSLNDVITVEGQLVDCNQQAVSDGYAAILVNDNQYHAFGYTDANGHFSVVFPVCLSMSNIKVVGFDVSNLNKSDTNYINNPTALVDVGTLTACTGLDQYLRLNINGDQYVMPYCWGARYDNGINAFTSITGEGNGGYVYFNMSSDAQTGTFTVTSFGGSQANIDTTATYNLNTTVTTYGPVGQYIEGNLSGTVVNLQGQTLNLDGQYRALRSQ